MLVKIGCRRALDGERQLRHPPFDGQKLHRLGLDRLAQGSDCGRGDGQHAALAQRSPSSRTRQDAARLLQLHPDLLYSEQGDCDCVA